MDRRRTFLTVIAGKKAAIPWYLAGGVAPVVAYQPKGATSLAASYINLVTPGTKDAAPGSAPDFDAKVGWIFSGTKYLNTGDIAGANSTMIVAFERLSAEGAKIQAGGRASGNGMYVMDGFQSKAQYLNTDTLVGTAPPVCRGVLAVAGVNGYRDGVLDATGLTNNANTTQPVYIGCLNDAGSPGYYCPEHVWAYARYASLLTAPQILAISNAIWNIGGTYSKFGIRGLVSQQASIGAHLLYEYTQAWSVGVTFKMYNEPAKSNNYIFGTVTSAGPAWPGYELYVDPAGKLHVRLISTMATSKYMGVTGTTNVIDGQTHRAWVTYDGSGAAAGVKIYLDGVLETMATERDALASGSITEAGQQFYIGRQADALDSHFNGHIKDFVLDNIVRDQTYVTANSSTSVAPSADAGVRELLLKFDEGTGTTADDGSGNNYDATLTNTGMWK